MLLNLYVELLSYLNRGILIDFIVIWTLFFTINLNNLNFFNPLTSFTTFIKTPLLNVRKVSVWRPYFKKDGYMGYFVDLVIWK